ncbi:MAG: hypothetical protein J6J24_01345 [Clostridia bacterium]|nr:hypothetical protein [Clostridia bacterium]
MENISKIVLSLNGGKRIGYVLDIAIDFDALEKVGYYVVDEESESVFLLKDADIVEKKFDYVVIDNEQTLEFCVVLPKSLIGRQVVSQNGQDFGRVKSLKFYRKKLSKIVTDKCEVLARFVKCFGEDFVLLGFGRKVLRNKRQSFKNFVVEGTQSVVIMEKEKQALVKPEKICLSTEFYVGKVCVEDVFGYNNERIVSRGEKISKSIVEKAKQHNCINQLFFSLQREK